MRIEASLDPSLTSEQGESSYDRRSWEWQAGSGWNSAVGLPRVWLRPHLEPTMAPLAPALLPSGTKMPVLGGRRHTLRRME